jgi:hypothetical protein
MSAHLVELPRRIVDPSAAENEVVCDDCLVLALSPSDDFGRTNPIAILAEQTRWRIAADQSRSAFWQNKPDRQFDKTKPTPKGQ